MSAAHLVQLSRPIDLVQERAARDLRTASAMEAELAVRAPSRSIPLEWWPRSKWQEAVMDLAAASAALLVFALMSAVSMVMLKRAGRRA